MMDESKEKVIGDSIQSFFDFKQHEKEIDEILENEESLNLTTDMLINWQKIKAEMKIVKSELLSELKRLNVIPCMRLNDASRTA
jgi:hypothetical protein